MSAPDAGSTAEAGPSGWKGDTPPRRTDNRIGDLRNGDSENSGRSVSATLDKDDEEELLREEEASRSSLVDSVYLTI